MLCLFVVIPAFPVSCRRLTPGPGYLEALCLDHVSRENLAYNHAYINSFVFRQVDFVSSPIKKFTATGIETEDGQTKDLDLVFCATGTSPLPPSSPPPPSRI